MQQGSAVEIRKMRRNVPGRGTVNVGDRIVFAPFKELDGLASDGGIVISVDQKRTFDLTGPQPCLLVLCDLRAVEDHARGLIAPDDAIVMVVKDDEINVTTRVW